MLTVGIEFMKRNTKYKRLKFSKLGSQIKWCQTSFVMEIFFHYVTPKNKNGLTPIHMTAINIQSLKYVNFALQIKIRK